MMMQDEVVKKKKKKVKFVDLYACKHGKKKYKFPVSYDIICKQRYHESVKDLKTKTLDELKYLEMMQLTAYEQTRFNRIFAITSLWPPLHTRKEINYTINKLYKLSERHIRRISDIMSKKF